MRVSVVVPTYRRPEALRSCLGALARQDLTADEILVVVRREDEASRRCVEGFVDEPIRVVAVDVLPGRPGFVAALNAGVAASTGEIVCFTDDDAEPWPDWISRIVSTFELDPAIGAVGGRDWVYHGDLLEDGEEAVVGTVSRWGRTVGRHHLGVGSLRDVAILKGANLSVRGDLVREVGFDRRLRGFATEHHSELGLCLALLRMGYRVVYDPAVAVDHRPRPRPTEGREFHPRQVKDSSHNETLALLEHLSLPGQIAHLLWSGALGTRGAPGLAQSVRLFVGSGDPKFSLLCANLEGRGLALSTYLHGRIGRARKRCAPSRAQGSSLLAVAHSDNARPRAEQLLSGVPGTALVKPPRGIQGMVSSAWAVFRSRAKVIYLVDVGKTTVPAALLGRLFGKRVMVDTGDACFALARSLGDRGFLELLLVGLAERLTLRCAHQVVVRGSAHAAHVPGRVTHIPDVAPPGAVPTSAVALRRSLGFEDRFVVGLVGSLILSRGLGVSYGWDLVEALGQTDSSVVALVVGDGSGREALQHRARELGVAERCRFVGEVPAQRVCEYICAMDVALSTQTNDIVGEVRTTGKLPLYLACHRPVLASDVGEAARVLGPLGWTIPFRGRLDPDYPTRLAEAVEAWRGDAEGAADREAIAARVSAGEFDPAVMRERLRQLVEAELSLAWRGN